MTTPIYISVNRKPWKNLVPVAIDAYKDVPLVIVGDARHVLAHDLELVEHVTHALHDTMAINRALINPDISLRIDHAVSFHTALLPAWVDAHAARTGHRPITHSWKPRPGINRVWKISKLFGGSTMLSIIIGISLGYQRVILAGCPLSFPNGEVYLNTRQRELVEEVAPFLRNLVGSCSGFTRKLFGAPWGGD